jgi:hypothetical protein
MKKLIFSATFTAGFGFLSVIAIILLYLSLSDIANHEADLVLEWYIAGICIIILSAFTISTFVTLGFLLRYIRICESYK